MNSRRAAATGGKWRTSTPPRPETFHFTSRRRAGYSSVLRCRCRASRSRPWPAAPRTCTRGWNRSRRTNSPRSPRSSALARSSTMLHPDLAAAAAPYCGPRPVGRPRRADNPAANSICTAARCSRKGIGSTTHFALRFRTCSMRCATTAAATPHHYSTTWSSAPWSSVHRSSSGGAPRQARLSCATATAGAKAALRAAPAVGRLRGHAQRARRRRRRRRHRAARIARTARHGARQSRR